MTVRRFLGLGIEAKAVTIDPVMPAALSGLRVRLSLFGKAVEVLYEVKGVGCVVNAVTVNGQAVSITHDANPYRKGAARMDRESLARRLDQSTNIIQVKVGWRDAALASTQ